jgi:hypothetical protein
MLHKAWKFDYLLFSNQEKQAVNNNDAGEQLDHMQPDHYTIYDCTLPNEHVGHDGFPGNYSIESSGDRVGPALGGMFLY